MKCKVLFIVIVMSLCHVLCYGQNGFLFDADRHLPSSFINQVYLDRDGFIWMVSRNGICRYDGYQFRTFKKEQNKDMASNYVNAIIQDKKGMFYLGMYGALQTFDGITFQNVEVKDLQGQVVPCYVTCFAQMKNGDIYVGTSGHGLLKMTSQNKAQEQNGELRGIGTVYNLMCDSKDQLWIVTEHNGLLVLKDGHVVKKYFQEAPLNYSIHVVREGPDGTFYVGTNQSGVYEIRKNGQTSRIESLGNLHVDDLCMSKTGKLLIGQDGGGVIIYDPKTGEHIENPYYSNEIDLSKAKVNSIVEDRVGNIWMGMLQKGIYMRPAASNKFNYMGYKLGSHNIIGQACVTSTIIDSKGILWVGTDKDGLYKVSKDVQMLRHYKENFPSTVLSLTEDNLGRIWIGSYQEGLGYIDPSGNYHKQALPQGDRVSVFTMAFDGNNTLWIGTMGNGLLRLNTSDGSLKTYTMNNNADSKRNVNSIINNYIPKITLSPDKKRLYVGTTMGACCLDIPHDSWVSTFGENCLHYGQPMRVVKEYGGQLWIGTNSGLYKYDLKTKKMDLLTTEEGMVDNAICSIEQDRQGRLWISTEHGLCCYDPKTKRSQNYFVDNGLQSNEFSDGASCVTSDGMMLFGGVGGITWFSPENMKENPWKATVKLSAFILNGKPITSKTYSGGMHITDTTVMASDEFHLSHHDNSFGIQLTTLTYDNPEHTVYLYSINGEKEVRMQPGQNEITFSHLSPGKYKFKVKAERNEEQTAEREFTVIIHSPWYQSWWAYCLYILALAFAIWEYLKFRKQREQDNLRLQEHIHAEQMGEAKLRFFMNISHEIRTPLTLILTPLLSLMKTDKDPQRQGIYDTMRRNSERILNLINQIMDLRKIDKGMMQMHMQETDMVNFVSDLHSLFEHQARSKNIQFNFHHDDEHLPVWIDRKHFDKVIVNLLSNAFKFTHPGGEIDITLKHDDNDCIITIGDTGEGIPEDKLERIFERFYQSPSVANDRNVGTGIGLDLTRSLVELHHGTIKAQNRKKGCEFIINLPLGSAHLKPEEIMPSEVEENVLENLTENEEDTFVEEVVGTTEHPSKKPLVIIAEDDDEIRNYIVEELSKDYDIFPCTNGREALSEALKSIPDLVISDIMMPEMDGNTLCTTLKTNPQTSHIPIILLTAKNRDEDKLQGLETGADAYIVKPFNMDILKRTVLNLITSRRQLRLKYERTDQLEQKVDKIEMQSPDDKLLERIMKAINSNLTNSNLSVDSIAQEVGISRVHLHRKMKELTGQTPHDFIRNIRLKQAANLLSHGDMNVTEVMYACGFGNAASFSTMFKKFYGMSPREYMQEHQKD